MKGAAFLWFSLFILTFFSSFSRLALWNIYWLFLSFYFRETCCSYFLQLNLFRDYQVMRRNYFFHLTLDLCFSFLLCLFWPFFSFNFFYPCFWSYHRHMKSIGFIASTHLVFNFISCYIVFMLLDLSRNFRLLVVKDFSFALLFCHFSFFSTMTPLPFSYADGGVLFSSLNTILSEDFPWLPLTFECLIHIFLFLFFQQT